MVARDIRLYCTVRPQILSSAVFSSLCGSTNIVNSQVLTMYLLVRSGKRARKYSIFNDARTGKLFSCIPFHRFASHCTINNHITVFYSVKRSLDSVNCQIMMTQALRSKSIYLMSSTSLQYNLHFLKSEKISCQLITGLETMKQHLMYNTIIKSCCKFQGMWMS